jgi:hypothetical protein
LVDRAEVKAIVGTGEFAEVDHQWVFHADVVVQADTPAAVVEGGDSIKVCFYPFKVASLLMDCRGRVPIKSKGNHFLANATLPRVPGAGRGFKQLEDSENKVQPKS